MFFMYKAIGKSSEMCACFNFSVNNLCISFVWVVGWFMTKTKHKN